MDFIGAYSSNNLLYLLKGFLVTIEVSALSILFAFLIGTVMGVTRYAKVPVLDKIFALYVGLIRNIPLLLVFFFIFFALPEVGIKLSIFASSVAGLTIYASAMLCEIVRSGLISINKGQIEAARASGLNYVQTLWHIVLPQGLKRMIPAIMSEFTSIMKGSSLAIVIMLPEMMRAAQVIYNNDVKFVVPMLLLVTFLYFIVNFTLSLFARRLERRLAV
ncbi:amino acid ABC transporter permease [Paenibacillus sp. GSMTC-2017]|uniref:amino acid ABC transporter permease n=1 Tax=Paenibacillus sp. GSMTC-2017 TaxID=2794350 RepID=UPI0018D99A0D|nr:amino acid ABC transporter permease [Paenibacillus sp. GSMTC-2017]MBH5318334.1 amino acid ABC transporter permease [Paenibacillus sp. GSMTC-2017]